MAIDLLLVDGNRITAKGGIIAETLMPETISLTESGDTTSASWSVGGVVFNFSYKKDSDNAISDIVLERSDTVPAALDNRVFIEKSANILTAVGGIFSDEALPDEIIKSNGENGITRKEIKYGDTKCIFTYKKTDSGVANLSYTVEDYTSQLTEEERTSESTPVSLVPFKDLIVCENGELVDEVLPDRIITVSDAERHFVYGDITYKLTWDKEGDTLSNISLVKL